VLLEGISSANNIVIDLLNVDVVDLAVLQLLCSAHRMAMASGKSLSVSSYPEPFTNAIREAGLSSYACRNDSWRHECLWPEKVALPAECR
ncbi:MAG: STAS domain-containing protein, partial [Nitrospiraceae bacterium]|nr:STAS domain-containing protein [Nitrospiraceae bacterium]